MRNKRDFVIVGIVLQVPKLHYFRVLLGHYPVNLPLSFHSPYRTPFLVFSISFCSLLWNSSGCFFLICMVSIRTRWYRGGNFWKLFQTSASAQPKHRASSTQSIYQKVPSSTGRPRFTITQHSFSLSWFFMSHSRSSWRFLASSRFVKSIILSPWFRSADLDYTTGTGIIPRINGTLYELVQVIEFAVYGNLLFFFLSFSMLHSSIWLSIPKFIFICRWKIWFGHIRSHCFHGWIPKQSSANIFLKWKNNSKNSKQACYNSWNSLYSFGSPVHFK